MSLYYLAAILLLTQVTQVQMDDQFLCCMKGIKRIRSVALCPAPCCQGYEEKVVYANKLGRIIFCVKQNKLGRR